MGGARHSTATTTQDWPTWLLPQAQQYGQDIQSYFQNAPQQMPANLYQQLAPFTPYQQAGLTSMADVAAGQAPLLGQQAQLAGQTLGGAFLDPANNPTLQPTVNAMDRSIMNQYQTSTAPTLAAEALRAGAMGGTGFNQEQALQQYGLGRALGDVNAQVYGQNFEQERQRQMQMEGLLPTIQQGQLMPSQAMLQAGTIQQQQQQQGFDTAFQNALRAFQFPQSQLEERGNLLSQARGPAGISTTVTPNRAGWLKIIPIFLILTHLLGHLATGGIAGLV